LYSNTYITILDPSATPGIPLDIASKEGKRGKDGVRRALQLVQHSTASMGRYVYGVIFYASFENVIKSLIYNYQTVIHSLF